MERSVITMMHIGKDHIPSSWIVGVVHAKYVHYHPVDNLYLTIILGMECS